MNFLSSRLIVGLVTGDSYFFYVVPAIIFFSHGTTNKMRPSFEGKHRPYDRLPISGLYVMCDPPTMHILLLTSGSSFFLISSAQVPVQLTTYLALTLWTFPEILSLNSTPSIFPSLFLMKLINYALLTILAGIWVLGKDWCSDLERVAVSNDIRSILASLKHPSSYTTPLVYLSDMYG